MKITMTKTLKENVYFGAHFSGTLGSMINMVGNMAAGRTTWQNREGDTDRDILWAFEFSNPTPVARLLQQITPNRSPEVLLAGDQTSKCKRLWLSNSFRSSVGLNCNIMKSDYQICISLLSVL